MTPTMGQTLWQRLTESPHDEEVWTTFRRRYEKLLHGFVLERTGDSQLAEEVTVNVFTDLFCTLADRNREPLYLQGGSFRPYLKTAASRAFKKILAARLKFGPNGFDPDDIGWEEDLERRVAEREQAELEVVRWAGIYRESIADLRRDPQYTPASFADFLTIYYHPRVAAVVNLRSGRDLDRGSGRSEGTIGKNARRFLDRLIRVMSARARTMSEGSPGPNDLTVPQSRGERTESRRRMLVILEEVWRKYGHLSD